MTNARGKRRTLAQRLGRKGELLFSSWAIDRCLGPNKVDEDFGIDYYSQVFRRLPSGSDEATGSVLSAQVRATAAKSKRARISLNQEDAVNLLRQTTVSCVISVEVGTSRVAYRFLDEEFVRELVAFVDSRRSSLSLVASRMADDPVRFDEQLKHLSRPASQSRLKVLLAELRLDAVAPGSRVRINQDSVGSTAVVRLPWIESAFQFSTESHREPLRRLLFDGTEDELPLLSSILKPEFHQLFDLADSSLIFGGGVEKPAELRVTHEEASATIPVMARALGDEVAYISDVGLSLVMSGARKKGEDMVHEFHGRIFRGQHSLGASLDALPFLRLLHAGAVISVDGTPLMPADMWGAHVAHLGAAVSGIEGVYGRLGLDLSDVYLDALRDEEFARSLNVLDAVLLHGVPWEALISGMVMGKTSWEDAKELEEIEGGITIPVVMNLQDTGIRFNVTGPCLFYLSESGGICGLRLKGPTTHTIERMARFTKSAMPEAWIRKEWPVLPLGAQSDDGPLARLAHPILFEAQLHEPEDEPLE